MTARTINRYAKPPIFLALLAPALWLAWQWAVLLDGQAHALGFNPTEYTNRYTGDWALRLIIAGLALTPLASLLGKPWPIQFRRMVGLFAFFYACLHMASYVGLDQLFAWGAIWQDIVKRNFITVGMIAFIGLIPLALTSTNTMVKRLGAKRWKLLHKLVYGAAVLGAVHYIMMAKGNQLEPLIYAGILAVLLGYRVVDRIRCRLRGKARIAAARTRDFDSCACDDYQQAATY